MPYTIANPPARIKKLPPHAIRIWVSAFNSAWKTYNKDEVRANKVAWAAVKAKYKKVGDKWVRKATELKMPKELIKGAVWTTKYINDLPDSAFAYIMPGGKKDSEGKTVPRSLRKLPYKDKNGKIDLKHLRNALSRAPQTKGIPAGEVKRIQAKLRKILERMRRGAEMTFPIRVSELQFAEEENTTEIQVVPVGTWRHPVYGKIKISEEDIAEFVENFENKVRKDIPITEGHSVGEEEKPAVGWFRRLINKGREGLWAIVEWTKKGKKLLEEKAYKYFSPEFYSLYEDPETHKTYSNVLVGGALTNRPYFKGLRAIVLSEFTFEEGDTTMTLEEILAKDIEELTDEEKAFLREHAEELSDEQKETYKDILAEKEEKEEKEEEEEEKEEKEEEEEEEEEEKVEGSEKGMVQLSEKTLRILERNAKEGVKAMAILRRREAESYVDKMTFSETNPKAIFLPKSREKVVDFLLSLTEKQQKAFKAILAELPKVKLFTELGKAQGVAIKASEQIQKLVEEKMEKNKDLEYRFALEQVLAENPELAEQAERE